MEARPTVAHTGCSAIAADLPLVSLLPPQPVTVAAQPPNEQIEESLTRPSLQGQEVDDWVTSDGWSAGQTGDLLGLDPIGQEETQPGLWEFPGGAKHVQVDLMESKSVAPEDAPEPTWRNLSDADAALFTGVRTGTKIHDVALAKIQHGYLLADRHAYYAARQEFIQVLRMISRALGAKDGTTERTTDLASGLRALEEAEDFVPRGTGLEADLDVSIMVSAHRTPVAQDLPLQPWLPGQLMDRYFRYAQLKLAAAVAGDPDGSIALHALGKLQRRLGQLEPRSHALAHRQAFAFQQAALLAHPFNHLAAHELGVLLADGGRYEEAECLLEQIATKQPHPVVLRNLAQVQYKLGHPGQAAENDQKAQQLAAKPGVAGRRVQWVSPNEFASAADATTFGLPTESRAGSSQAMAGPINSASGLAVGPEARQGLPAAETAPESKAFLGLRWRLPHPVPAQSARAPTSPSYPSRFEGVR